MRVLRSLWGQVSRFFSATDRDRSVLPLETSFARELQRHLDPWPRVTALIVKKLKAQGVHVSDADRARIEAGVRGGRDFTIDGDTWKWWRPRRSLTVTLTEEDGKVVADEIEQLVSKLPETLPQMMDDLTLAYVDALRRSLRVGIQRNDRQARKLEKGIADVWREPFESLSLLIELCYQVHYGVQDYYKEKPVTEPHLLEVLTRLHTRSIHVAREVLALLRCGYADAAMARWRTLHEVAVVMCFLSDHGEECAKRYLDHDAIEAHRAAEQYQKFAERLGYPPLSAEELGEIRAARDAVAARYESDFRASYGWAAPFLQNAAPRISTIEEAVGLDHLRPFYKLASHNVHPEARGILFKIGTRADEQGMLLVGPSPYGLADPGQSTGLALSVIVAHLTRICPAIDVAMAARAAQVLAEETADKFMAVHESLEGPADDDEQPS